MYKIKKYFQGVFKQGKMVRWPTAKDMLGYFAVIVSVLVFCAVACVLFDFLITKLLTVVENNLGSGKDETSSSGGGDLSLGTVFRVLFNYVDCLINM